MNRHHDQADFIPGIQSLLNINKSISETQNTNGLPYRNNMVIYTEKAFGKVQHPFTNTLKMLGLKGT